MSAALYAFVDWVGDSGNRRSPFIPGQLLAMRGFSLNSRAIVQRFRRLRAEAREMFAVEEREIHLDNERALL